jgi:hypothetical protein
MRSVRREVRLMMVDVGGEPVRLMTMGRMSMSIPSQRLLRALTTGVYRSRMSCSVCGSSVSVQYFYSPI